MTDETMTEEPTVAFKVLNTRAYIMPDGTVEFRNGSTVGETADINDAEPGVQKRLANECMILLHLKGKLLADILDGSAIPARAPPASKEKIDVALGFVISARAEEIFADMKRLAGSKVPAARLAELRAEADDQARAQVATLTPELLKKAKRHSVVKARMLASKNATSLGEMFAPVEPEPAEKPMPEFLHQAAE
jgi:hypothetical protein